MNNPARGGKKKKGWGPGYAGGQRGTWSGNLGAEYPGEDT